MNKFLLLSCLFISVSANAANIYQQKDIHFDGVQEKMLDSNNQPANGMVKVLFPNGTVQKEIPYEDGIKNRTESWYYSNGNKRFVVHWKNGKYNGTLEEYREDGTPRKIRTYENGIKNGKLIQYHSNGEEKWTVFYKNGEETQEEARYAAGTTMMETPETDDSQELNVYYKNGNPKYIGKLNKNTGEGTATIYYRSGGKAIEVTQIGEKTSGKTFSLSGTVHVMSEDEINVFKFMSGYGLFMAPDNGWNDKLIEGFMHEDY